MKSPNESTLKLSKLERAVIGAFVLVQILFTSWVALAGEGGTHDGGGGIKTECALQGKYVPQSTTDDGAIVVNRQVCDQMKVSRTLADGSLRTETAFWTGTGYTATHVVSIGKELIRTTTTYTLNFDGTLSVTKGSERGCQTVYTLAE